LADCVKKTLKHTVIFSEYKPFGKKNPVVTGLFVHCDEQ